MESHLMSTDISPENEQFIQQAIRDGWFQTRSQALNAAVELLKRRRALLAHVDEGTRQLQSGQYVDLDGPGLRAFFDDVQARGREAYEESKKQQ
jgi:Arc/MetJ-type ribon-helix-helix transcriptional regulator